jgi:hypothetical protein
MKNYDQVIKTFTKVKLKNLLLNFNINTGKFKNYHLLFY